MEQKPKSILIIVILLVSVIGGIFVALTIFSPTTPANIPAENNGAAWISEVNTNTSLSITEEYFEVYLSESFVATTLTNCYVTTFDEEGMIQLPEVTGTGPYDYIAIYSGTGTNDLDASDGNATIYLGLETRILDPTGDEIGFFDEDREVIDFMRYDGGNGDDLFDDWDATD
ncbi:MAG: hypothetical protein ACTSUB_00750, partial [Candidatus Thorarchaeota archaeon]